MIVVTGGAGFIGSNFVLEWLQMVGEPVVNIDKLTYAGNPANLEPLRGDDRHVFVRGDIGDRKLIRELLGRHQPRAIINFAAESHVDRSIRGPERFVETNVGGTFGLLEEARLYWSDLPPESAGGFRFLHVSTDEVYGSLELSDAPFTELTAYRPSSPYAASKAASDHIVRAYHRTYGMPVLVTNCSNNYGPYQFPEKLIPLTIVNALEGKALPVYGSGRNVRDWLYVGDHCSAVRTVLERGAPGETYNIGGWNERPNIEVVQQICDLLDELSPAPDGRGRRELITFVRDRPGHDLRYAIDASKIATQLDWRPAETFDSGLGKTVRWYLDNQIWVGQVTSGAYRQWLEVQYGSA